MPMRSAADRDHFACPFGRNAGAIAVCRYEASAGDAPYVEDWGQFDIGIKRHADWLQHRRFQREDLGDRRLLSGMTARARFPAAGGKPSVQRRKVCKAWRGVNRHACGSSRKIGADLVLDLAPRHWA